MKKKLNIILLSLILLLSAFLRLYKISDYMVFLGDEGRDVLVVKQILEGDLTLLGPRSSAGDFFTGPVYYYMIAPFLWLSGLDPVGPAVMIALLGIATVFLIYYVASKFFNKSVGLVAASLYAVSPLVVVYSRSSWNPNPMPFFTLLLLYVLYLAVQNKSWKYFLAVGFLYGIALQLHYIELFVGVIVFFFTLFSYFYLKRKNVFVLIKQYLLLLGGFLAGFSPFLAFEIRHGFPNTRTILNFITNGDQTGVDLSHMNSIQIIKDVFFRVFARTLWDYPAIDSQKLFNPTTLLIWQIVIVLGAFASIYYLFRIKNRLVLALLFMWLFFGVTLFGFYEKIINDYNFEFLFPLPFLLTGHLLYRIYKEKKFKFLGKVVAVSVFLFIFIHSFYGLPFRKPANRQVNQARTISEFVLSKTNDKPFNFALLTGGNSDHAYRYFFSLNDRDPVIIENPEKDPERKSVSDQLMIVCEDINCRPLGHPLFEVAGFGRAEIDGEWDVSVVKVYKLVHYKGDGSEFSEDKR